MRIDQLLNKLCLTKTRSIAKNASDKALLTVNGKAAKASTEVKAGDLIGMKLYGFDHQIKILEIPTGNVAKANATQYYEIISKTPLS
ncbi:MAG TPA: S4 domain-containing protein [Candidatus Cloacimonadota bacterium]|nr:S4 domain-containing protein [Candidatus Cloacimonadota bacterium]